VTGTFAERASKPTTQEPNDVFISSNLYLAADSTSICLRPVQAQNDCEVGQIFFEDAALEKRAEKIWQSCRAICA